VIDAVDAKRVRSENVRVAFRDETYGESSGMLIADAATYGADKVWCVLERVPALEEGRVEMPPEVVPAAEVRPESLGEAGDVAMPPEMPAESLDEAGDVAMDVAEGGVTEGGHAEGGVAMDVAEGGVAEARPEGNAVEGGVANCVAEGGVVEDGVAEGCMAEGNVAEGNGAEGDVVEGNVAEDNVVEGAAAATGATDEYGGFEDGRDAKRARTS
jgi:hypothetical protein